MTSCADMKKGEKKLIQALKTAQENGHKVCVKNYDEGFPREEGMPEYISFNFTLITETADGQKFIDTDLMPSYEGDGCNDVVIEFKDGAELYEYPVWYQDNEENRVYLDEIENYLDSYGPLKKEVS